MQFCATCVKIGYMLMMQALGKYKTKAKKNVLCYGTDPIASWNFPSLQPGTKTFRYFSMVLPNSQKNHQENKKNENFF